MEIEGGSKVGCNYFILMFFRKVGLDECVKYKIV